MNEEVLLSTFQQSGSRESLRELLLTHQSRVYNACFQVLGRAADAEDAAQDALMKLAEGARTARDADSFRGWIYRVSLRAAIDLWRRREATRARESRAAMIRPASPPLDDRERLALFEAMDGLEDRDRSLLLEHYFEKVPLETLGARRSISAVAIWKRIDKAREKLKKALLGGGFVTASARVGEALEGSVLASAPTTLVGDALVGKLMAGGLIMATAKSSFWTVSLVAAVLVLILGVAGYGMLRPPQPAKSEPVTIEGSPATALSTDIPASADTTGLRLEPERVVEPVANRELLEKLEEYRALFTAHMAEVRSGGPVTIPFNDKGRELMKKAQPLVLADPSTFLAFLCDPANEEMCRPLINHALDKNERWNFKDLPVDLANGILEILKSGKVRVKGELLAWLRVVNEPSEPFEEQYVHCLNDPDPLVQSGAMLALWRNRTLDPVTLERARTLFETAVDPRPKIAAIDAISRTHSTEVARWIGAQLQANRNPELVQALARAAYRRLDILVSSQETPDPRELDQFTDALMTAARVQTDWFGFSMVVGAALRLPADRSVPVLEEAMKNAHTASEKTAVESVLAKVRAGGHTPLALTKEFQTLSAPR